MRDLSGIRCWLAGTNCVNDYANNAFCLLLLDATPLQLPQLVAGLPIKTGKVLGQFNLWNVFGL